MDYEKTLEELKHMKVETGSFVCLGCGHEHNCSIHGCAILRDAVVCIEELKRVLQESEAARAELGRRMAAAQKMNTELTEAQATMVREFEAKLEELHEAKSELERVKAERDAAVTDIAKIAKGGKTWMCPYCKHGRDTGYGFADCDIQLGGCKVPFTMFEWRGPQKEGT